MVVSRTGETRGKWPGDVITYNQTRTIDTGISKITYNARAQLEE